MLKFIHAADIHLDSPLVGLPRYAGAPVERLRGATRQALRNLVQLAVTEQVDLVLFAGDLYDGDWRDYNTGLFFAAEMTRLRAAGIRVIVLAGNHDAASQITRHLRLPDNVTTLATQRPESIVLEALGVVVHGQGFATRAVTENLAAAYPAARRDLFNIGLLHTALDGREGHAPYAPCALDDLLSKGYDYWALGHVHQREVLHRDPWIVFPGNIQGRHIRETGPKGCTLVTVRDRAVVAAEHHDLDVLRWSACAVDTADAATADEVVSRTLQALAAAWSGATGRALAVRVTLRGACAAHGELAANPDRWLNEIRAAATDLSAGDLWIEQIALRTQTTVDPAALRHHDDALGGLLRAIQALEADDRTVAALADELHELQRKLPAELQARPDAVPIDAPAAIRALLPEVQELLLARLLTGADHR